MESVKLAVIGGGSVATSFLYHVVGALERVGLGHREPQFGIELLVFEPNPRIGRGGAYADDLDSNLLNVTAGMMSVAGDDRLHFYRWLSARGITTFRDRPIDLNTYLPRPLFGRYLEEVAVDLYARAQALGVSLVHVRSSAIDVQPNGRENDARFIVHTDAGGEYEVQRVVLALGNLDGTFMSHWRGSAGYFDSPYPTIGLAKGIRRDAEVGIVGTSLSAVDAIAALAVNGHTGPIRCYSRNGRLPSVRGLRNTAVTLSADFHTLLEDHLRRGEHLPLRQAVKALASELLANGADLDVVQRLAERPLDNSAYLDREILLSECQPRQWQAVGNALNEVVEKIWHLLSDSDREQFDRTLRPIWMARRVTFPIENARLLQNLLHKRQLTVEGNFERVERYEGGRYRIIVQGASEPIPVDCVVNATSFSCDAGRSEVPVLRALQRRGLARPDRFGGLQLDFATGGLRRADEAVESRISVLGSMAAGTYFWTNSMDVNARLALQQARRHVAEMLAGSR